MGLYAPDGSLRVTLSTGTGRYAPDGSLNVTFYDAEIEPDDGGEDGPVMMNFSAPTNSGYIAAIGA